MQKIYQKALRLARMRVFDDEKYTEIIQFCKYKLDNKIYTRNENITMFSNGTEYKTNVFVTESEAKNFNEYKQKQLKNKNITNVNIIF